MDSQKLMIEMGILLAILIVREVVDLVRRR
jgi:hypothetical protein